MKLRAENTWTKVVEAEPEQIGWLDFYLSYEDTKAVYVQRKMGWGGDGKTHLLDKRGMRFPTGLLSKVTDAAREEGYDVETEDARVQPISRPPRHPDELPYLWDHQDVAVRRLFRHSRGIIKIPCGGGKTRIAVAMADRAPCHWLYLVHRVNLMRQTAEEWEELIGQPAGRVGPKQFEPDPERRFTCATYQAIKSSGKLGQKLLTDAEGFICDEAHTVAAATFWKIAMQTRRAYWRCGLSATPLARGDKRSTYTVAALGPVLYEVRPSLLIKRGLLSRPIIRVVSCEQEDPGGLGWQAAYGELIVRGRRRNAVVVDMCRAADRPMMVTVTEIPHGKNLAGWLNDAGISAEFCWGAKDTKQREAAIKRLRYGDTDALVGSVILQEGADIPELAAVVNAGGRKTEIGAVQRLGRGSRIDGGRKPTFQYWDVQDWGNKYTERHSKARIKAFRGEGYDVEVITEATLARLVKEQRDGKTKENQSDS